MASVHETIVPDGIIMHNVQIYMLIFIPRKSRRERRFPGVCGSHATMFFGRFGFFSLFLHLPLSVNETTIVNKRMKATTVNGM